MRRSRVVTTALVVSLLWPSLHAQTRESARATEAVGPIDVAIIVDTGDVNPTDIRTGLKQFFAGVTAEHAASLQSLSRPATKLPFTSSEATFDDAVAFLHGRGLNGRYTSVRDAILEAARSFGARGAPRRAIVVISDQSFQTGKTNRWSEFVNTVEQSGARLFHIALSESQAPYGFRDGSHYIKPLTSVSKDVPEQTGGRVINVLASSGVPTALLGIADELNR
jgi:hypothetical protein